MWYILNACLEQINSFNRENIKTKGKTSFGDYVQSPAWKPRGGCGIIEKNRKISGKGFGIFGLEQFSMSKVKTKYSFSIPRTLFRTILKGAFL